MNTALVLIDIQQDYFPGGRMEVVGAVEASLRARVVLDFFRSRNLPVVHVRHVAARPGATFLLPGTDGIEIRENVRPLQDEAVVVKHYPNSFRDTELEAQLKRKQATRLVFCGMMSHMCIDTTVRAAFDRGYSCLVAHDACATRDLQFNGRLVPAAEVHASYMAALGSVFAKVAGVDEIMTLLSSAASEGKA